ncbi:unnamed protein product [Symbiodinium sp. KB8]|nr:unnamed protein product [Symbiodinium sp. KB8]
MVVADFDGDGDIDVLLVTAFYQLRYLEKTDRNDTWLAHFVPTFPSLSMIVAADLDGDGDLDIVVASRTAITWCQNLSVQISPFNCSDPVFDVSTTIVSVEAADIDGDGDIDIFIATQEGVKILENSHGNGTFKLMETFISPLVGSIEYATVLDLDRNINVWVVAVTMENNTQQSIWVQRQWNTTMSWSVTRIFTSVEQVVIRKDKEASACFLTVHLDTASDWWLTVYQCTGLSTQVDHRFNLSERGLGIRTPIQFVVADIDADGRTDAFLALTTGVLWYQGRNATHMIVVASSISPVLLRTADVNGDGVSDLIAVDQSGAVTAIAIGVNRATNIFNPLALALAIVFTIRCSNSECVPCLNAAFALEEEGSFPLPATSSFTINFTFSLPSPFNNPPRTP